MYLAYALGATVRALKKLAVSIFLLGIIFFSIIFLLISFAHATDYTSNYEKIQAIERSPPKVGSWKYTPTVVICEPTPIGEIQTQSAIAFWENLGYKFSRTIYKKNQLSACTSKTPMGFIVVKLVSEEESREMKITTVAQTHFYVNSATGQIEWAIIYLRTEPLPIVFEHEIGHALGFLHYNKIGHLMHEKLVYGGWSTEGLNN